MATALLNHNQSLLSTLEEGDMVEIPRGRYSHWAVYVGRGKVIHLAGDPNAPSKTNANALHIFSISGVQFDKAWVREDDLIDVAGNSKAQKNNNKDKKATPSNPKTIVERARSKLGQIGYNVLWRNCEYFASWCRYGDGWSQQVLDS
ncbi:hypothetical protein CHS0354_039430 [Potamilus streckersoni]|uniref:LRAT domain-containing protein n=1 Tax=Potamilus streckersoni TaxID=2493646 RepID=A0AAE0S1S3_9BIVA|nr:hypothetical protein CHS0354_039430 [Potamilus streckersoni]